ncbi:conjugal transfer protein TraN (plasmid) [Vibrio sp. SS-MA-C1-2]|uniref:conjugal transfer protein TraN n=1 Tax=Vibrio sp. SS-MA-C1-2 TaxID=2908646 RepID=UPI001F4276BB|nr:conjugal transfer protein TraN [Vibrio sp. SS-MA-C1-2]UJF20329.1 conjugal transfer protein TraN [Vibrio sp. SS-MA-C1-2]
MRLNWTKLVAHTSIVAMLSHTFHYAWFFVLYSYVAPQQALAALTQAQYQDINTDARSVTSGVMTGFALPSMDSQGRVTLYGKDEDGNIADIELGEGELLGDGYGQAKSNNHFEAGDSYQDEYELDQDKNNLRMRIDSNTEGAETDYDVAAWNTLKGSMGNRQYIDTDDTLIEDTEQIFNDLANSLTDENSEFFSACTTQENTFQVKREYVGTTEYQCQEPDRTNLDSCEIKRYVDYPVRKVGGTGKLNFEGDRTFTLTLGDARDNRYGGSQCALYQWYVDFKIRDDVEIESATLVSVAFDDVFDVKLNDTFIYQDYGPFAMPSYSNEFYCERSTSFVKTVNQDITNTLNMARDENNGIVRFYIQLGVADLGEGYAFARIKTKNNVMPKEYIEQVPAGCATQLGYVQPQSTCDEYKYPGHPDYINPQCGNDQTFGDGQVGQVCSFDHWECTDEDVPEHTYYDLVSSFPDISSGVTQDEKHCTKINASGYLCNPVPGMQVCSYPNAPDDTNPVCTDYTNLNQTAPDTCAQYRENPDCSLVSTEPTFVDPVTGKVYINESVYSCNVYSNANYAYTMEENLCTGDMHCVGGDCAFHNEEFNDDFGQAMAMFKMMEDIKQNMTCTDLNDVTTCRIFEGEARYCGVEKTGMGFNCCTLSAGQTSVLDYLKMTYSVYTLEQSMETLGDTGMSWGGWASQVPTPISDGVSYVSTQFSDGVDYVARNVSKVADSIVDAFGGGGGAAGGAGNASIAGGIGTGTPMTPGVVGGTGGAAGGAGTEIAEESFMDGISSMINGFKQEMMRGAQQLLGGPDGIGGQLFTNATDEAGRLITDEAGNQVIQLNPAITAAFQVIAAIYAAYQIVQLAITMISACEDEEMSMGMTIDEGKCTYYSKSCHIDTPFGCLVERKYFCCYPSPLGRIVMEQAAQLLGHQLDPENGQCYGMTIEDVAELDWSQIDFSEWEEMIMASGLAVEHSDLDLDTLSHQPWMSNNDEALNPVELQEERFQEADIPTHINDRQNHLQREDNLDCSVVPRPAICGSPLRLIED